MEPQWSLSLHQSQQTNACLSLSQCLYLTTQSTAGPHLYQTLFRGFGPNRSIVCHMDRRSRVYRELKEDGRCEVLWSFPLTNEVYRFACPGVCILDEGMEVQTAWDSLKPREKTGYVSLPPDTYADSTPLTHDIDSFRPQSQDCVSSNFAIVRFEPRFVDHMRYIDKAAIGNTRKTYESLPQPEVQPQRWEHSLQGDVWTVRRVNAPHPCP